MIIINRIIYTIHLITSLEGVMLSIPLPIFETGENSVFAPTLSFSASSAIISGANKGAISINALFITMFIVLSLIEISFYPSCSKSTFFVSPTTKSNICSVLLILIFVVVSVKFKTVRV